MESINGLYKAECIRTTVFHEGPYRTIIDVEFATAGWVDWYNNRCLHSSRGNVPTKTWLRMSRSRRGDRASQSPGRRNIFTGQIDEPIPVLNYRTADVRAGRCPPQVSWINPEVGSFTGAAVVVSLIAWY